MKNSDLQTAAVTNSYCWHKVFIPSVFALAAAASWPTPWKVSSPEYLQALGKIWNVVLETAADETTLSTEVLEIVSV